MNRDELLHEYQSLLRREGPDSDAAYELLIRHIDETEFIHHAEEARLEYTRRRAVIRFLRLFAPLYFCLVVACLLMMWFG